jgi:hypothetical protein
MKTKKTSPFLDVKLDLRFWVLVDLVVMAMVLGVLIVTMRLRHVETISFGSGCNYSQPIRLSAFFDSDAIDRLRIRAAQAPGDGCFTPGYVYEVYAL